MVTSTFFWCLTCAEEKHVSSTIQFRQEPYLVSLKPYMYVGLPPMYSVQGIPHLKTLSSVSLSVISVYTLKLFTDVQLLYILIVCINSTTVVYKFLLHVAKYINSQYYMHSWIHVGYSHIILLTSHSPGVVSQSPISCSHAYIFNLTSTF